MMVEAQGAKLVGDPGLESILQKHTMTENS